MYALIKKLFVTSERGHPITELPARRKSIKDGEIQTGKTEKSLPRNQANFIHKQVRK